MFVWARFRSGAVHPQLHLVHSREVEDPTGNLDDAGNGLAGFRGIQRSDRVRESEAPGQPGAENETAQERRRDLGHSQILPKI